MDSTSCISPIPQCSNLRSWSTVSVPVKPIPCSNSPTKNPDSKSSECSQQNFCLEHRLLFRLATLMHQMDLNPRTGEVRPPPNVYPFGKGNEDGAFSYSDGEDEKGA
ncbi:unnamed protein product [Hymenolepis diminuta]|uniref:Uncharacterized protein n=1 Tax=Hymenolepis diminuta TaxID=6216 RepID=A0A0R3SPQ6_HYMDI|nr:unnamed protein product [Hymenolepis diminuta]VUZ53239.1 unnamed protein product [Hymenolepis diminuta]